MPPPVSGSLPSLDYAMAGVMRGSMSRANDHSQFVFIDIAGAHVAAARDVDGEQADEGTLSISETEGETPNTCTFRVRGFQPTDGQEVIITMGSINNLDRTFAGLILHDAHSYTGSPANGKDTVSVIDYTWLLTRGTITQRWTNESGTVIARAIIAHADRGFTSLLVEEGLPTLDEFTVSDQTHAQALGALCQRLGATWKATYSQDVQLGLTANANQTDPTTLTEASGILTEMENFVVTRDLSQVITRQPVEGGGGNALADVAVGATILPVSAEGWYNVGGGLVACGPQKLAYTGVQAGGGGALVGPGVTPSTAPELQSQAGTGLTANALYTYAYSWVTAAGQTLPSPIGGLVQDGNLTTFTIPTPVSAPSGFADTVGFSHAGTPGATYEYAVTYQRFTGETVLGPTASHVGVAGGLGIWDIYFDIPKPPDAFTDYVHVYRRINAGSWVKLTTGLGWSVGSFVGSTLRVGDVRADSWTGDAPPGASTAIFGQVNLLGIAIGPAGTTGRNIWRTVGNGSQLKLHSLIANNTSTSLVSDSTADGSLGANAPTSDTSGLAQPVGQVNAGSTTLLLAGAADFDAGGGFVAAGPMVIRYAGISGNTLTGIPATGSGSITATVTYNTTVVAVAALLGIPASGEGSIRYAIKQGDPVNLRVVIDDLAAQAVITALMLPRVDDGIIEGQLIQDGRISETEARARGTATLAQRSAIAESVSYTSRDKNTRAGRTIPVNLAAPTSCVGSYKIQQVSISNFLPARWPVRQVSASSSRFTLEDFLRRARGA